MKRTLSTGVLLLTLCVCMAERSAAQPGQVYSYTINTAVGAYQYGNGGPASQALLSFPRKMAFDSQGALYIADISNHMVRKIVGGQITTIAGTGTPGFSGDGQAAASALLNAPAGVAVDGSGNVYIYDTGNSVIRKVSASGVITTFAGTPKLAGSGVDLGPATQAKLNLSASGGVTVDAAGNVYFSDTNNQVVRKVTVNTGIISVFAGVTSKIGGAGDGGAATAANLFSPAGLAFDSTGNLFIADAFNSIIRMVSAKDGTISTVAGSRKFGSTGDGGPAKSALLSFPQDVAVDAAGNLYIADTTNLKVRKVTAGPNPTISTLAGNGTFGYSGDGGAAVSAQLTLVQGVAVDRAGILYIADTSNNRIRTVSGGTIGPFAGANHATGDGGKASAALLYFPQRLTWDAKGNLFIADRQNNRVREVTPDGNITTVAGNGSYTTAGDGGPALSAGINQPQAVAVDSAGNIYLIAQSQVRKVDTQGNINTVVNTKGTVGYSGDGGAATTAQLNFPLGLAVDSADNLYIADTNNHRIRKVSAGNISTVAGTGPICAAPCNFGTFGGDGGPATSANLSFPYDVTFDSSGNMLIADTVNYAVRSVDANTGTIKTIAGTGTKQGYGGDLGPATSALLFNPFGIAADNAGNVYIADSSNFVVRVVDGLGVISTIAGNNTLGFSGDGGPAISAQTDFPYGIGADPSGNVWFADVNNHRIRQLTPSGPRVGNGPIGVVNAASFVPGGLVPGGMATLFGSHLTSATGIHLASGLPLATELLKSSVKFNNALSAPILAVDNVNGLEQINFQVPWELAGLSSAVLQVSNDGALSPTVRVPVLAAQPGVFAYQVGADFFGAIQHADFTPADQAHPVAADEVVLIFCTNLGAVSPAIKDGVAASGKEMTVAPTTVTIGGAPATVSFSGLAPNFVGLYQVNAKVPKGLAAKNQPVVVSVSGASSKPVLLPVK